MGSDSAFEEPFYLGEEKDKCIRCGHETPYKKSTHIDFRDHYVEGAGQLCVKCFNEIYKK